MIGARALAGLGAALTLGTALAQPALPAAPARPAQSAHQVDPATETPLAQLPDAPSLDPRSMDRSVDPCENFYRYACGG